MVMTYRRRLALQDFASVQKGLEARGVPVTSATLQYLPLAATQLDADAHEQNERMREALLNVDDVDEVYCTFN